jgi:lipid-A-disaccharide synthase
MPQLPPQVPPRLPRHIAMIAGEASGDLIASLLVKGLHANAVEALHLSGVGGPAMQAAGFNMQVSLEQLAVRGYVEVLRHLPRLLALRRRLAAQWLRNKPAAFIGVDAPDFNLGLELKLRAGGIKTIHLVCPSIWAWRRERVEKIRQSVSHMLCIFPFEQALLEKEGIPATYVGHPIADMIAQRPDVAGARAALGLQGNAPVIALLPGSRRDEIKYIAPRFMEAAALIKRAEPETQFVLPAAGEERRVQLQPLLLKHAHLGIKLTNGQSHTCLAASDAVLVASGTATLEAALFKKPMVIAYAMPAGSYWMMKDKGYLPYVGLPNILCEEFVVPELLQHHATPTALADAVLHQLRDGENRIRLEQRFTALHASLQRDFTNTAARTVLGLL